MTISQSICIKNERERKPKKKEKYKQNAGHTAYGIRAILSLNARKIPFIFGQCAQCLHIKWNIETPQPDAHWHWQWKLFYVELVYIRQTIQTWTNYRPCLFNGKHFILSSFEDLWLWLRSNFNKYLMVKILVVCVLSTGYWLLSSGWLMSEYTEYIYKMRFS